MNKILYNQAKKIFRSIFKAYKLPFSLDEQNIVQSN